MFISDQDLSSQMNSPLAISQEIVNNVPFGIIIHEDGNLIFANYHAREILEIDRHHDISDLRLLRFVYSHDKDIANEFLLKKVSSGTNDRCKLRMISTGGTIRNVEIFSSTCFSGVDQVNMITFRDITDRKKTENALRNSESNYKITLDSLGDGIHVIDRDYRILLMNKTMINWHRELGLTEEVIGRKFNKIYPFLREGIIKEYDEVFTTGRVIVTVETNTPNDEEIYTETRKIPIYENGNVVNVITVIRNITNQIMHERAIQESEEKYRDVVERANDGILIAQDYKVKFANRKLYEIVGIDPDEKPDFSFEECLEPDVKELLTSNYYSRLNGEDIPSIYEIRLKKHAGEFIHVEINSGLISYQGKPADLVIVRDITERKKTEDQIFNSMVEKGILLKEINHRVKNNLQLISSLLDLQRETIGDKAYRDMFRESQNRIKSIALIHEKLYNSGNISEINFGDYIQNLTESLQIAYVKEPKKLELRIDSEDICLEIGAAIPCAMIVNELITNSLKHAFLNLDKGIIEISMKTDKGRYILIVRDNGAGLPEDFRTDGFENLGLQLVKMLADQLHGELRIESSEGVSVEIAFPIVKRNNRVST